MEINLTQDELNAFEEMGISDIEAYLKSIASTHIQKQIDITLSNKTLEDKKKLLTVDTSKINLET